MKWQLPIGRQFGALLLITVAALPSLLYPLGRDQAMFAYIGSRWLQGGIPYQAAWDIKPPGIDAVYALAEAAFGSTLMAPRIADLLATLAAAVGLFVLGNRQKSSQIGCIAALLFGLTYFGDFSYWDSAQAESFAAPLTVLFFGLVSAVRSPHQGLAFAAGISLGMLILLKKTYALFFPAGIAALWFFGQSLPRNSRIGNILAYTGAVLIPPTIAVIYFSPHTIIELLEAQRGYANHQWDGLIGRLGPSLQWFFLNHPATLVLCLFAAIPLLASLRFRVFSDPDIRFWGGWLGLAILMVLAQGRLYWYHWLPCLLPLALLASKGFWLCRQELWMRKKIGTRVLGSVLLLAAIVIPQAATAGRFRLAWQYQTGQISQLRYWSMFRGPRDYSFLECAVVARYIHDHTRSDDPILVYAFEPAIYYLSDRVCPTRHLSKAPLTDEVQIPKALRSRWIAEQKADIIQRPPVMVVTVGSPDHGEPLFHVELSLPGSPKRLRLARHDYGEIGYCGKFHIYARQ